MTGVSICALEHLKAVYPRLSSSVFFISFSMTYSLQYWNERAAEWRGTGCTSHDPEVIRDYQYKMIREMTGASIRFRVLSIPV